RGVCGGRLGGADPAPEGLRRGSPGDPGAAPLPPGARMPGWRGSPPLNSDGPADEKPATCGASTRVVTLADSDAVGATVEWMYDLIARPCVLLTCTVGTKWKSASSSCASLTL